ncbi:MAG TPA: non-ribosomal peptide synthase/polyketide synthase [Chitinophagaceae bacterium]|nr:non-ribosomal peptide synthase/polyketide synthase [Chitinophagaceae bacterium]
MPIQYKDYAVWQQEQLSGEQLEAHRSYWLNKFAGELPVLELPADNKRPPAQTFNGEQINIAFSQAARNNLQEICNQKGATMFMGLMAVLKAFLYKSSNQPDLIVGSPVAGRDRSDLEGQIGIFVNTLCIRTQIDPSLGFTALLDQVKETSLGAFNHQAYPFDKLVDELNLVRDLSRNPLFDVAMVMRNVEVDAGPQLEMEGMDVNQSMVDVITSLYDLTFWFSDHPGGIALTLEYNTDIYHKERALRMAEHLQQLLDALLQFPEQPLQELDYLSEEEQQQLLHDFNRPVLEERTATFVDLFAQQAARYSDRPAAICGEQTLDYASLQKRANQLANYILHHYPVKPDQLIGLMMDRQLELPIALLAILKTGAAYLPIDPGYPTERIQYLLQDGDAQLMISDRPAPTEGLAWVNIHDIEAELPYYNDIDLPIAIRPGDLAYVMYTSGSTGKPKGVMIEHRSLLNYLLWANEYYFGFRIDDQQREPAGYPFAVFTSLAFDLTVTSILTTLLRGDAMYLYPGSDVPRTLETIFNHEAIRAVKLTPSHINLLKELDLAATAIDTVIAGGEVLTDQQVSLLHSLNSDIKVYNEYGPTETTVGCSIALVQPGERITIGKPISNMQLYVMNEHLHLQPVGVYGEIFIGGTGVARGYHHRNELTAERFIANAFGKGRLYRTGDTGYWLPDGTLVLIGRSDDQVKIRGYRIEPGEIEQALSTHHDITQAVVIAHHQRGDTGLVAYYTASSSLDVAALRTYLRAQLPEYMIPSWMVQIESIPLTPNGKLDKKALPEPDGKPAKEYIAPRTATEKKLAAIWKDVLNREQVGMADNFFDLGGHSLKAVQVMSRVYKELSVKLELKDLFTHAVLSELAELVTHSRRQAYQAIERVPEQDTYPLSHAQRRLWILNQFEEVALAYYMAVSYRLKGELDRPAFEAAFTTLVDRHESLRTVFELVDGEPRQRIRTTEDAGFAVDYKDMRGEENPEAAADRDMREGVKPFNLQDGPLLRVKLLQVSDTDYLFMLFIHHIISDEWSMQVIVREVLSLYNSYHLQQPVALEQLPIQYKDYAAWQQQELTGEKLAAHQQYWLDKFSGEIPVLNLPGDRPRPAVQTYRGEQLQFVLPQELTKPFTEMCRQSNATLFMGVVALVKAFLFRYTGDKDIIVGFPVAGREHPDLENQIGFYVNTLALRTQLDVQSGFAQLLDQVKQNALEAYNHQVYPFDRLVEELKLTRDMSRSPLFDVMVTLENAADTEEKGGAAQALDGIAVEDNALAIPVSMFDLTFFFREAADGMMMSIEYNMDIYDRERIERIAKYLQQLLSTIIEQPAQSLQQLQYLTVDEQLLIQQEFNNTAFHYEPRTVVDMFAQSVANYPNAIALVAGDYRITYRELNERANRLAHYLRTTFDVQPGELVGSLVDRSEQTVITLLAILKSGAAFLSIDPDYPEERINYLLQDASVKLLLTDKRGFENAVLLQEAQPAVDACETHDPLSLPAPHQLAQVIYTSGSTGKPKGVLIEHASIADYIQTVVNYFNITHEDAVVQQCSVAFDTMVEEVFAPLSTGAKLVIAKEGGRDIEALASIIDEEQVTIISTTPLVINGLNQLQDGLSSLRVILSGGDELKASYIDKLIEKVPVYNTYGPAESTICTTYNKVDSLANTNIVGKPIANRTVYIVDEKMQLQGIGVRGEICIGGAGLARGYHNREELTAEKFIANPFGDGRLYRTGDTGYWLPDGRVVFTGRYDHQVKIRGYRIELGEVEQALTSHENITQAVVTAYNWQNEKSLVGYYVPSTTLDPEEVRSWLSGQLPAHMVPSWLIPLESIPLTPNGKIDKKALPDPQGRSVKEYIAPRNSIEKKLAGIWQSVLNREQVGMADNFFEMGGHSLKAVQVMSRIYKDMSVKLELKDLFTHAILSDLAALVANSRRQAYKQIERVEEQDTYPISHAQRRLWVLNQFEEVALAYIIPMSYRFKGMLDGEALAWAFHALVERHESLRTVFELVDGEARQRILTFEQSGFAVDHKDLRNEEDPELAAQTEIQLSSAEPFDLERGPLLKVKLLRIKDDEHLFLFNIHHIISDEWSINVLVREVLALYDAYRSGKADVLPPLRIQYKDYAAWQLQELSGESLATHQQYWLNKLSGELPVIELAGDRPRPPVKTYNGKQCYRWLPTARLEKFSALNREQDATLFMGLVAIVKLLLYRYTGQQDIIVGSPVAGREHPDLEDQIGFYVNTLVLRTQFNAGAGFRGLLQEVKQTALEAYNHQVYPFDRLVEDLDLSRDMSRSAIFDVMVSLENLDEEGKSDTPALDGVEISDSALVVPISKFDLTFHFGERPDGLQLSIEYNTDIFNEARIEKMCYHLDRLLGAISDDPDKALDEYEYLADEEVDQLLREYNATTVECAQDDTLVSLFEQQVANTPDNFAIIFKDERLTYAELNGKADRLAHYLSAKGAVTEMLIPICIDRSIEMIVAILGVLKAGCAYVPIDPDYPADRIRYMLEDTGASMIITTPAVVDKIPTTGIETIVLDEELFNGRANTFINPDIQPNHLAYIIYTSGSTGKPKGVMIEHRNVVNFIKGQTNFFGMTSDEKILQFSNYCFDASVEQIFLALLNGASLVMFPQGLQYDIDAFEQFVLDQSITHLHATPGFLENLKGENAGALRRVVAGGDLCKKELAAKWMDRVAFYNKYGPTEITVTAIQHHVRELADNSYSLPIGRPVTNGTVYIVDKAHKLVTSGNKGEICVGGAQVARGYLNRPELTEQKFIDNPFTNDGSKLYKTGDLGRWLPDGTIEYLGRIDEQVKIRGYRIEPGEVERALASHPAIKQAVVIARSKQDDKFLVGYFTSDETLDAPTLKSYLQQQLPDYMIPAWFVQVENIPLTPNGKVDKKALPQADGSPAREYIPPRTTIEKKLVAIWEEVLNRQQVGMADNFFDLGGHSLKAVQVMSRIYKELSVKLELKELFTHSVLSDLALLVTNSRRQAYKPIDKAPEQDTYPISHAQRRLWVLNQFEEMSLAYIIPLSYRFRGTMDGAALSWAFHELVQRHESLRTVFELVDGEARQRILPFEQSGFAVDHKDLRNEEDAELAAQNEIQASSLEPFDLQRGPLLRVKLLRIKDDEHLFLCNIHHIISDEWSINVLIGEVLALYDAHRAGKDNMLAPLPIQYKDYAVWQLQELSGESLAAHQQYWLNKLSGELPVLELPGDRPRPPVKTHNGKQRYHWLPTERQKKLLALNREQDATLFMGLVAAVKLLLYRYTGQTDIIIGSPVAGREHPDLEGQIGFYVNTLVLRTQLDGNLGFRELLQQVKQTALEAYNHQVYPFDRLVEDLDLARDVSRSAVFDVMVALQNRSDEDTSEKPVPVLDGVEISDTELIVPISKFDLTFHFGERPDGIMLCIEYNTDIYNDERIERMCQHLDSLLGAALEEPGKPVSDYAYLAQEETELLLQTYNSTAAEYPADKSIVDLFEEQAAITPSGIALEFEDKQLTYQELNYKADRVAAHLLTKGATAEMPVPVCIDRSPELIIAILGILKAGCAYVPIDPKYPADRIRYMLQDTGASMIISSQSIVDKISGDNVDVILLSDELLSVRLLRKEPFGHVHPASLAYIMYTSGSTGTPKGVMVTHGNVVSLVKGTEHVSSDVDDILLSTGSASFDATTFEYWSMLLNGGRLVMCAEEKLLDTALLKDEITNRRVSKMWFTSSWFNQVVDSDITVFEGLQTILVGGEKLSERHIGKLKESYPSINIINGYGPTENTTFSLIYAIQGEEVRRSIPIGCPLNNRKVYILDKHRKLVAIGNPGEICVGGAGLSRGYLNREELTAEKFIDDPFSDEPGAKLYRTGDLGRWLTDGNIEYLGRMDEQVKIRGYRIEPGEIENMLTAFPGINQAVVVVRTTQEDKFLAGYFTADETIDAVAVKEYLKQRLPDYMVPAWLLQIESMPLTPNGKVDKKALPQADGRPVVEYIPPRTTIEKQLAAIWQEVLNCERVGMADHFFDMGGHSLKAVQVMTKIYKELSVKLGLNDLFTHPVLADLAALVTNSRREAYKPIERVEEQDTYAVSHSQRRLWVLNQFEEVAAAYNIPMTYSFTGELDTNALTLAFETLVQRHESLRTVFEMVDGEPRQRILTYEQSGFAVEYADLRNEEDPKKAAQAVMQSAAVEPFDLQHGPLLRVKLLHIQDDEYKFLLNIHHIVSDGWSNNVLIQDVLALYEAYHNNKEANLPPLIIQYKDYAAWQLQELSGDNLVAHQQYWLDKLSGELPVLQLAGDKPRPAVKTYNGKEWGVKLPAQYREQFLAMVREQDATLFMGSVALVKLLLYRYTGQQDIIVGSPVAGREHPDLEFQIGFYVNTLALRTQLDANDNFRQLLQRVKETSLGGFEHQVYPFDRLVEDLNLPRDMSRSPLFDVMVTFTNHVAGSKNDTEAMSEVDVSNDDSVTLPISKFDLTFNFTEHADGILLCIEYNTDIYTDERIEQMGGHVQRLLDAIFAEPAKPLHAYEYLSQEEQKQLLQDFNNTTVDYPQDRTIIDLFEQQVANAPANLALSHGERQLTYEQLNEKATDLARHLLQKGITPEMPVPVCIHRSIDLIVAMLGIMKAGGAYVPVDPEYPADRIRYMLEDTGATIFITTKPVLDKINSEGISAILIDDELPSLHFQTTTPLRPHSHNLAYIIYTSGSTGKPKGVMIEHRNLANLIEWHKRVFGVSASSRATTMAGVGFDAFGVETWPYLSAGASIHIVDDHTRVVPQLLLQQLTNDEITHSYMPTALVPDFVKASRNVEMSLRYVFTGGDKLLSLDIQGLAYKIVDNYGPAENTIVTTIYTLAEVNKDVMPPIGKPIDNTSVYILGSEKQLQPVGVPGEIYIAGAGLARGYFNREALTQERFASNPYANDGSKIYRTGDLGRWLPDGNIEFMGRIDEQVKIRGYRIELGEIENVLATYPGIRKAVVILRTTHNDRFLVCYYTADVALNAVELREFLRQQLPDYMVPAWLLQLENIPLTPNGKVDRKALPQADGRPLVEYIPPRSTIEKQLVAIWQEILDREQVSMADNFFDLGGHSLKAVQVMTRIYKDLSVKLELNELFTHAVLADLAVLVTNSRREAYKPIERVEEQETYPVSHSQRRLWVINQFEEVNAAYNIPISYKFVGELDRDALERAFHALVARHESLRTVFEIVNGEPRQRILSVEETRFAVTYKDLRDEEDPKKAARDEMQSAAVETFDLLHGPLLRVTLLHVQDNEYHFLLNVHHIVSDGWSNNVMIQDTLALYEAYHTGKEPDLVPLTIQYKDYAAWQLQELEGEALAGHQQYWLNKLSGELPILELAGDRPRPPVKTYSGNEFGIKLSAAHREKLLALVREHDATLFMGALAAVKLLLYRYTGQQDIIIGTPVAGREHPDLEFQIGFYVNTLALRTRFDAQDSFIQLLQKIKETSLGGYQHQVYPFDRLVEDLKLPRDLSRSALFDVMVTVTNYAEASKNDTEVMADVDVSNDDSFNLPNSKFDLTFNFAERPDGMLFSIEYNTDIFNESSIERMCRHMERLLEAALDEPTKPLHAYEYLSADEVNQLLHDYNNTMVEYPKEKTIVDLLNEQAAKTPGNLALASGDQRLTYEELEEAANRLAGYLIAKGITPETPVPICMGRSAQVIVAMLAVLKAGAAYVPIDPGYPVDRIRYMLEDVHASIIISTKSIAEKLVGTNADIILLDDESIADHLQVCTFTQLHIQPEQLAYIIYTSGSTGRPKGVMIEHRGFVNLIEWQKRVSEVSDSSKVISISGIGFDAFGFEVWPHLAAGASVYIMDDEKRVSAKHILQELITIEATHCFIATALVPEFVKASRNIDLSLRYLLTGGDKLLSLDTSGLCYRIVNNYGPTENTVVATHYVLAENKRDIIPPIGSPIDNTRVYILGPEKQLQPAGVPGEICIAGTGIARGYLNQESLTQERFIPNPFAGEGAKMYKTGDLGRWLPDGNIEYMGRIDQQVKMRGYRIELGEIENVMTAHHAIAQAVVVMQSKRDDKFLVGYYTAEEAVEPAALKEYLRQQLPDYMIPAWLVQIESIPLTPNGKVDKKALPQADGRPVVEYIPPRTAIEKQLVAIWQEVLGIAQVGMADNFFDLGGHSLKAVQVMTRIYKDLSVRLELNELFTHGVLSELALLVTNSRREAYKPIERVPEQETYPISHSQRRLWVLNQFEEVAVAYNIPITYTFVGDLDREALEKAFDTLVQRHESLRTVFEVVNGEPRQRILPAAESKCAVEYIDLRNESESLQIAQAEMQAAAVQPFDLQHGPLLRVKLLHVKDNEYHFLLNVHHIISDGWSNNVLIQDVLALYDAYHKGKEPNLPDLTIQYKDYAAWQLQELEGENLATHQQYWLDKLSGELPVLSIPGDRPRPPVKTYNGNVLYVNFSAEHRDKLLALVRDQDATLFMGVLAMVKLLLYRYTGQQDMIVGSPVAGREHPDLEFQIGFYVNTLALRTQFDQHDSFIQLLQQVKDTALDAYRHQVYPFDRLVEDLDLARDMSRSALFDVMVTLTNNVEGNENDTEVMGGIDVSNDDASLNMPISKFDVSFFFAETTRGLSLGLEYNTDIFNTERIERMGNHLQALLDAVLSDPAQPLHTYQYIDEQEKEKLLQPNKDVQVDEAPVNTAVQRFEAQAAQTPDAIAVISGDAKLTYKELNEKANQLAHYLIEEHSVVPEELVGLRMERDEWLVIAILGVFKSGAAYLPIDMNYPSDRVQYMLQNSAAKLVLDSDNPPTLGNYSTDNPVNSAQPNHLAYVIYTSGSTGEPKGVMIEHHSVVNMLNGVGDEISITASDVLLAVTTHAFDMSVVEILLPLVTGAQLVLASNDAIRDVRQLSALIGSTRPTIMQATPGLWNMLASTAWEGSKDLRIISGGESIPQALAEHLLQCTGKVWNMYGPTEVTVYATQVQLQSADEVVLIGKPLRNTQAYILDEHMQLVGQGIPGTLYIGGAGLARGYINREDLTAERFVQNPFAEGERLYNTGDICCWVGDGRIRYFGRNDDQVKIRGYRIEPGEVEKVLRETTGIQQGVIVCKEKKDDKFLVAYYTADTVIPVNTIRNYMRSKLPDFMMPSWFVQLEKMPLTPNGKIDKKALPEPDKRSDKQYIAPRNAMEEKLAAIWMDVLEREKVGVEDNFFELGGHSLKAVQMMSFINKAFGSKLTLKDVLNGPTVESLAKVIAYGNYMKGTVIHLNNIRPGRQNIYFVPALIGSSIMYMGLAAELDNQFNCYGLQDQGFDADAPFAEHVDAKVKHYMDEILAIHDKEEEIVLFGFSFAALMAYETAKLLERNGHRVKLVVLDSSIRTRKAKKARKEDTEEVAKALNEDFEWSAGQLRTVGFSDEDVVRIKELWLHNISLRNNYVMSGPINGEIMALKARDNVDDDFVNMKKWKKFTTNKFSHFYVLGNHYDVLALPKNMLIISEHLSKLCAPGK